MCLRECVDCGIEALTDNDLELFAKDRAMTHGRKNLCRSCHSKRNNKRYSHSYEAKRERHLQKTYGISTEDYNTMFKAQKGCCAICNTHQASLEHPLFVDHCHTTGDVRGLLCRDCNLVLGFAKDSKSILKRALEYL